MSAVTIAAMVAGQMVLQTILIQIVPPAFWLVSGIVALRLAVVIYRKLVR